MELRKAAPLLSLLTVSEAAAFGGTCRAKSTLVRPVLALAKRLMDDNPSEVCLLCLGADMVSDECWGCGNTGLCQSCHFVVGGPVDVEMTDGAPLGCTLCLMCGVGRGATTQQFTLHVLFHIAGDVGDNTEALRMEAARG